jgi:hypothetical protein
MNRPDIISAMTDRRLFGRFYEGASWSGWQAVLRGAFGLKMTEEEITFFRSVAGREPPGRRVKELVLAIGRRGGKDAVAALIAAFTALSFKPDGRVRAGERPLILLLAADRAQSRNLLRYIEGLFSVPALKALIRRETQDGFELANGIDVTVGTADWRTIRGRTVLLCIMNELAFWRDETSSNPDKEIYRAVVPATATLGDQAMIVMISSVHRRAGLLYEKWDKHFGQNDPNTLVVTGGTRQFNPMIDQKIIDDALADDPQAAAAEYLNCQWRDDVNSYLTRQEIMAVVDKGTSVRFPQRGVRYVAHLDASSGQGKDSLCCCVGHRDGDVCIIDNVIEIAPPFQPASAISRVSEVLRSYDIKNVTCDRWGLGFVEQELQRNGISVNYSDKNSSELFRQALPIITSQRCRLLDHERATAQFVNLERRALAAGGERISHPNRSGHHDDVAVVIAGCLVALSAPMSNADGWLRLYERLAREAHGGGDIPAPGSERDDVRAGDGQPWSFHRPEDWCQVRVPAQCRQSGFVEIEGVRHVFSIHRESELYFDCKRCDARIVLGCWNPIWREANRDLCKQLGIEEAA